MACFRMFRHLGQLVLEEPAAEESGRRIPIFTSRRPRMAGLRASDMGLLLFYFHQEFWIPDPQREIGHVRFSPLQHD